MKQPTGRSRGCACGAPAPEANPRFTKRASFGLAVGLAAGGVLSAVATASASEVPFAPAANLSGTFGGARAAVAADFDRDGDLDVLATASGGNVIAWFENDLDDGTACGSSWCLHGLPGAFDGFDVEVVDLDGDGDLDALGAAESGGGIRWWRNDLSTGGGFPLQGVDDDFAGSRNVAAGDLDGDGDADVVATNGGITWWRNDGNGVWPTSHVVAGASDASGLAIADIDRDGDLDLVTAGGAANALGWWENDGAAPPAFAFHAASVSFAGSGAVAVGDVDGDGRPDILAANTGGGTVDWFEWTGPDEDDWTAHPVASGVTDSEWVSAADLDGDGDLDVLGSAVGTSTFLWWENTAGNGSAFTARVLDDTRSAARSIAAADLDGDGDADLLTTSVGDDRVAWYENDTIHRSAQLDPPTAGAPHVHDVENSTLAPAEIRAADIDRDGDIDLVVRSNSSGSTMVWHANPGDGIGPWAEAEISVLSPLDLHGFDAGDLDGDGDVDLVGSFDGLLRAFQNLDGAGGAWSGPIALPDHSPTAVVHRDPVLGDIDGDGDLDIAYFATNGAAVGVDARGWLENTAGDGSAWAPHEIGTGAKNLYASSILGDVDRDGDFDFVDDVAGAPTWWENPGSFAGWTPHIVTVSPAPQGIELADLDGDGDLDVVVADRTLDRLNWFENDGVGDGWTPRTILDAPGSDPRFVTVADLDADGDLDVAVALDGPDAVRWFENRNGLGTVWTERTVLASVGGPRWITHGDFDRDGRTDLAVAAREEPIVAWIENQGGQVAFEFADLAPATALQGEEFAMASFDVHHRGRAGDGDLGFTGFQFLFEDENGPLTPAEAAALFTELAVYRDAITGVPGSFDPADTLVGSQDDFSGLPGALPITLAGGASEVAQAESPARFFVAVTFEPDGAFATPNAGSVAFHGESFTAIDATSELPLEVEPWFAEETFATGSTTAIAVADLSITKSNGEEDLVDGEVTTYTMVAGNAGPSAVDGATVSDTPPVSLTGCTWTCDASPGAACAAGGSGAISESVTLPVDGTATFELTCTVDLDAGGTVINTASVAPPAGVDDPAAANDEATDSDPVLPATDLAIVKSGPEEIFLGAVANYEIVVTNDGPDLAAGVGVTDQPPAGLLQCSWTCVANGAGASCNDESGVNTIDTGVTLPAATSATIDLECTLDEDYPGSTIVNTADVHVPAGVRDASPDDDTSSQLSVVLIPAHIFSDGFESGDVGGWNQSQPE